MNYIKIENLIPGNIYKSFYKKNTACSYIFQFKSYKICDNKPILYTSEILTINISNSIRETRVLNENIYNVCFLDSIIEATEEEIDSLKSHITLPLEIPSDSLLKKAQKLYNRDDSEINEFLLKSFKKEELESYIKNWEELGEIKGYYIDYDSEIKYINVSCLDDSRKNIFATEKQAKSALAMAQLSQLMKDLGEECKVKNDEWKFVIMNFTNGITGHESFGYYFLSFKTKNVRDKFMVKHERLIKDYFMID